MNDKVLHGPIMVSPLGLFDDDGRLPSDEFRARLDDLGIIKELESRGLWLGDGSASGDRPGIGFRDLEEFYGHEFSPSRITNERTLLRSGARLRESAQLIKQALKAYEWARSLGACHTFDYEDYFVILRPRSGVGLDMVHLEASAIEEDVLKHVANRADVLGELAERVSVRGNKSKVHHRLFCDRWADFARTKCNTPLDSVGCRLSEIIFGTAIDEDSFRRARKRAEARKRKAPTGLK